MKEAIVNAAIWISSAAAAIVVVAVTHDINGGWIMAAPIVYNIVIRIDW